MATTAEELQVKISAKFDELTHATNKAKAEVVSLKEVIASSSEGIKGSFEMLERGMASLTVLFTGGFIARGFTAEVADATLAAAQLARTLGTTADTAQAYIMAMKASGVSTDAFAGAAQAISRAIITHTDGLRKLGIEYKDNAGVLLPLDRIVMNAVETLKKYKQGTDQQVVAMAISRRGYQDLIQLTKMSNESVADATRLMKELGLHMDPEQAKEYRRGMAEVKDIFEAVQIQIGQQLLPSLIDFSKWFATTAPEAIKQTKEALEEHSRAIKAVIQVAAELWAGNKVALFFLSIVPAAQSAIGSMTLAAAGITTMNTVSNTFAATAGGTMGWIGLALFGPMGAGYLLQKIDAVNSGISTMLDKFGIGKVNMADIKQSATLEDINRRRHEKGLPDLDARELRQLQGATSGGTGPGKGYLSLMSEAESKYGLPPGVLKAIAGPESNWNPKAVSPAGAQGLMQLMPATQSAVGVTNPFDASQSITGAAKLLKELFDHFHGDMEKTVAAYNAGAPAVDRAVAKDPKGWLSLLPKETREYVPKVMGGMGGISAPPELLEEPGLMDAKRRALEQDIANETSQKQAAIAKEKAMVTAQYKDERMSAEDYYVKLKEMDDESTRITVDSLRKKKELYLAQLKEQEKGTVEYVNTQTQIKAIDGQIAEAQSRNTAKMVEDASQVVQAHKALQEALDNTKAKLDAISGKNSFDLAPTRSIVADKYKDELKAFTQAGSQEGIDLTNKLIDTEAAQANLAKIKAAFDTTVSELQAKEQQYNNERQAELISEYTMRQKIEEAQREAEPSLQELIDKYQQLLALLGNPDAYTKTLTSMKTKQQEVTRSMDTDLQNVAKNLQTSFADALSSIVTGSASAGEAMDRFFKSILDNLARLAANKISDALFGGLLGDDKSGGGGGLLGGLLGGLFGKPGGGGSSLTDSELFTPAFALGTGDTGPYAGLAMLHPREMVLPREVADFVRQGSAQAAPQKMAAGPTQLQVNLSPEAINMTLRDWLEREMTNIYASR
jgi:hypothetical protein